MALVLCPECGEETVDQLVSCPLCNEPLTENQANNKAKDSRLTFLGMSAIGGLTTATLSNMMGFTVGAIVLGTAGVVSLAVLTFNMFSDR